MPLIPKQQPPYYSETTTSTINQYVTQLTQTGTSNPVSTEARNTLNVTIPWTRISQGVYNGRIPINNIFLNDSKIAIPGMGWGSAAGVFNTIGMPVTHAYTIYTYQDVNGDGIIELIFVDNTGTVRDISTTGANIYVEIIIYP